MTTPTPAQPLPDLLAHHRRPDPHRLLRSGAVRAVYGAARDMPDEGDDEMSTEAAAFHGLATNRAYPVRGRLESALQALSLYEAEVDRLEPLVEAAKAWRAMQSGVPTTLTAALIAAVDALDGAP